jgi:predicted transcriptional regulator
MGWASTCCASEGADGETNAGKPTRRYVAAGTDLLGVPDAPGRRRMNTVGALSANLQIAVHRMAADIIAAYLTCNDLRSEQASTILALVRIALQNAALDEARNGGLQRRGIDGMLRSPAVPIPRSITPRYLICLEEGRQCRNLEHHLRTAHGMQPAEYRSKWDLPPFYPMRAAQHRLTQSSRKASRRPRLVEAPEPGG